MPVAGVDIGSLTAKAVIMDGGKVLARSLVMTGHNSRVAGRRALELALEEASLRESDLDKIVATGYGRLSVDFEAEQVTEITCHARGAHHLIPEARTVIDLGGQDSKAIALDENGRVVDFVMNDKCAAGTGRFLEVMAAALEIGLENLGEVSLQSREPAAISSVCTVFAESEVISRIAEGVNKVDIAAGIHQAIASRVYAMAARIPLHEVFVMTGGVARNVGVVNALEKKLNTRIVVPRDPQHVGALGAAVIALERAGA